jgi:hypothetical protein
MAAEPTYTVDDSTLVWRVRGNDLNGVVADLGNVTTEWVDQVGVIASALESGSPRFRDAFHNGHSGVEFIAADDDILRWPLSQFDDCLVFLAYVADSVGAKWQVALDLYQAADPQGNRNLFAHRYNSADQHAYFHAGGGGGTRAANSSTPDYSPTLTVLCFGFINGTIHYYYDGLYRENDNIVAAALDTFDRVALGGDPNAVTGAANAFDGVILEAAVFHRSSNTDGNGSGGHAALLADVERILGELATYYAEAPGPNKPVLILGEIEVTTAELNGSTYSSPTAEAHLSSQWQVTLTADGAFASPVVDVTSGTDLETHTATGLLENTGYISRVRYRDASGDWSSWSLTVGFTTDTGPNTPTVTITDSGADYVTLSATAYVAGTDGHPHASTQWQVTLAADTGFASPVRDETKFGAPELTLVTLFELNLFTNQYIARARYTDDEGNVGAWSAATSASGLVTNGQFYTPFGERALGFALRTALWDEVWADLESTWINTADPDAICLVVSRRTPDTPTNGEVDPIFWQGFVDVADQIIHTRVKFEEVGTGSAPCASGDTSPNGIICRVTEGLEDFEDFTDLSEWRVVRSGLGGWTLDTSRGAGAVGVGTPDPTGNCLAFTHFVGDTPNALILWDGAGTIAQGKWIQARMALADMNKPWDQTAWPGLFIGSQDDVDGYSLQNAHQCGLFATWCIQTHYKHGALPNLYVDQAMWRSVSTPVGPALSFHVGDGGFFEFMKGALTTTNGGAEESYVGFGSRRGFKHEHRLSFDGTWSSGKIGLAVNACGGSQNGSVTILFDHVAVCTSDVVTVTGLPDGWYVKIGASTISSANWFGNDTVPRGWPTGNAAGDPDTIDFRGHAWPYDTLYLYDQDDVLIETWDVPATAQGPAGIWGGDVYNINPGGAGVGDIGGPSARNTGTPGGTTGSGYYAYLAGGTELRLDKGDDVGGLVNLGTFAYEYEPQIFYNIVIEAVGTTIRAKVWHDGETEPAWQISVTDATYASGKPGLVALDGTVVDFDVFAAGIGGDTYPTGRNPGTPVWVNPTVPFSFDATQVVLLQWTRPPMTNGVIGGAVSYELQYRRNNGEAWTDLATVVEDEEYLWNTTTLQAHADYCVRVRCLVACEAGPYAEICSITVSEEAEEECPEDNPEEGVEPTGGFAGDCAQGLPVTHQEECDGGEAVDYPSCGDAAPGVPGSVPIEPEKADCPPEEAPPILNFDSGFDIGFEE